MKTKKSASRRFFLLRLLWLAGLLPFCHSTLATEQSCPSDRYDESVVVNYVHDGDTVKLDDGRNIRLIGINAPEVARDGQKAEDYAVAARDFLSKLLLQHNNQARLVHGSEKTDHYQRTLAHLFLPDGMNVQAQLLASGLVSAITIPPNSRFSSCYQQAEKQAVCANKALWPEQIRNPSELDSSASGFHVLQAKLLSLQSSSKGLWLNMEHGLSLRIATPHQALFDRKKLQALLGQSLLVRGWLQAKKNPRAGERFYMEIKHPSAIDAEKDALKC